MSCGRLAGMVIYVRNGPRSQPPTVQNPTLNIQTYIISYYPKVDLALSGNMEPCWVSFVEWVCCTYQVGVLVYFRNYVGISCMFAAAESPHVLVFHQPVRLLSHRVYLNREPFHIYTAEDRYLLNSVCTIHFECLLLIAHCCYPPICICICKHV